MPNNMLRGSYDLVSFRNMLDLNVGTSKTLLT